MSKILIIDDDRMICEILEGFVESLGHEARHALTLRQGRDRIASEPFDLVILDVRLPDGNGLKAIPEIRQSPSSPEVIIITGEGTPDGAQLAVESGSWDYLQKPLSTDKVKLSLTRALQYRNNKAAVTASPVLQRDNIIGRSRQIRDCLEQTARAAHSMANVLIRGETGTGKELFARAIHDNSARAGHPFVVVDCAAVPGTLVESVLFGHVKGAFTGADRDREGLVKDADGGTLFLDEVGELPKPVQSTFLRVLQERRFRPVGGKGEVQSDFRLLAATNRDLDLLVQQGNFRNDLLFRLKSLVIHLPPLRDRMGDIPDLTLYFLSRLSARYGLGLKGVSPDFVEALLAYDWPGNVRELQNTLESALSSSKDDPTLHPIHLPVDLRSKLARSSLEPEPTRQKPVVTSAKEGKPFPELRELMESVEKKYLQDLITHTGGSIKEVCRISGISRANIYARLKRHGITRRF